MKKTLLFGLVVSLALPTSVLASTTRGSMGDPINVPIQKHDEGPDDCPRTLSLFSVLLDTDLNYLSISTLYNVGYVDAVIENLTTGEYAEYSFYSGVTAYFPISGDAGSWRITLTLENDDMYGGVFEL